jgi:hypothetical protein
MIRRVLPSAVLLVWEFPAGFCSCNAEFLPRLGGNDLTPMRSIPSGCPWFARSLLV